MSASGEPIGRHISVVAMGNTDRDHPIEDAIMDAAHLAGDRYGFDVTVGSGPYYYEGDETDRKLAEVTVERDRLREFIEKQVLPIFWLTGGDEPEVGVSRDRLDQLVTMAREALGATVAETERPTWYLLWCRYCHPDSTPMPFDSPEERGKWAAAHTAGTGHDQWRVMDQPKDARG